MTLKKYDAGPRPSRKKPTGGLGGRSSPSGFGFRDAPAARVRVRPQYPVRVRPQYPELPVPGPRRDMGLGLGLGFGFG